MPNRLQFGSSREEKKRTFLLRNAFSNTYFLIYTIPVCIAHSGVLAMLDRGRPFRAKVVLLYGCLHDQLHLAGGLSRAGSTAISIRNGNRHG